MISCINGEEKEIKSYMCFAFKYIYGVHFSHNYILGIGIGG